MTNRELIEELRRYKPSDGTVMGGGDRLNYLEHLLPTLITALERAEKWRVALSDAETRFGFIKNHTSCIGSTLVHVDGNCPHCSADYFQREARRALEQK